MGAPLVLALSLLAAPQQPTPEVSQREIDAALDRAVAWVSETGLQRTTRIGEEALAVYAAIHGGADPQEERFHQLAQRWSEHEFRHTYDTACVICALAEIDEVRYFPTILRAAKTLMEWQESGGDWGYPSNPDLSNTQYGALGLWKAASLGIEIPSQAWQSLADRLTDYQAKDGEFTYRAKSDSGSINMTVAGTGTLALCEQQLRLVDLLDDGVAERLSGSRAKGVEVLADRMPPQGGRMSWPLYGIYGLERLGAWSGLEYLGAHDWYQKGADTLVATQREDGSWGNLNGTSFAILFLARATAGAREGVAFTRADDDRSHRALDPDAWCWLELEGNGPSVTVSVDRWNWNRLRQVEFPAERGRGPHVRFVEYWLDGERVAIQLADENRPILNRRFKKELHVRDRGEHELEMRFHLKLPDKAKDEHGESLDAVIVSQKLRFVTLWNSHRPKASLYEIRADGRPRLDLTATSSSKFAASRGYHQGSHAARSAFDGDRKTAWLARGRDGQRWIKARFRNEHRVAAIRLFPALQLAGGKALSRPRLVELRLDGGERRVVVMPDDGTAGAIEFSPPLTMREVEILVKTRFNDESNPNAPFGFTEVEFDFVEEADED